MTDGNPEDAGSYELSFLIQAPEHEAVVDRAIAEAGGAVTLRSPVRQIRLAYPVKKQGSAYFGFVQFRAPRAGAAAIGRALALVPGVLRHLVVAATPKAPAREPRFAPRAPEPKPAPAPSDILSNEALEAKLEEILK